MSIAEDWAILLDKRAAYARRTGVQYYQQVLKRQAAQRSPLVEEFWDWTDEDELRMSWTTTSMQRRVHRRIPISIIRLRTLRT